MIAISLSGAPEMILVHKHPSGGVERSEADDEVTMRLAAAVSIMGVRLQDHIIIGGDCMYSYRDCEPELLEYDQTLTDRIKGL